MKEKAIAYSVFTKPWKTLSAARLAEKVRSLGFDGIEFPLRDGYQVQPEDAVKGLPKLAARLAADGLRIFSVASSLDENVFAACAEAGVPMIRIMAEIDPKEGYMASERAVRSKIEQCQFFGEKYGVKIGVQPHCGNYVSSAIGLYRILDGLDPRHVGAVWDAGHDGLQGEGPGAGLDILWSRLCMVNLKNARYRKAEFLDRGSAKWQVEYTTGKEGFASWPVVADELQRRQYRGVVCLSAEYSDHHRVDAYIAEDIAYAKTLFGVSVEEMIP
ncbi:sugar phosphate isomerase/epimerase family protein [Cohnella hongkongensis]|uniref:Sugar phosphate isomerase/epimerase family protein n=1 Tax=Cohnella hongkongensis TaxID=178337 RepID=A0ABV9F602_9BACL